MDKEKLEIQAITEIDATGKMTAIASDESIDRHGDSLKVNDWNFKQWKKNPVLQAGHDYRPQYTVGIGKNIRVDGTKVLFDPVFHDITPLAREIGQMYREGILRAWSVGFIPAQEEGRKHELLEISAVAVPANAEALVIAKGMKPEEQEEVGEQIKEFVSKEVPQEKEIEETSAEEKPEVEEVPEEKPEEEEKPAEVEKETKDILNDLIVSLKDGRVISKKNRNVIKEAITALEKLLDLSEPSKADNPVEEKPVKSIEVINNKKIKGRDSKVAQKSVITEQQLIVRALQNIAKNSSFALDRIKNK